MNEKMKCLDCGSEDLVMTEFHLDKDKTVYKCRKCFMELYGWELKLK